MFPLGLNENVYGIRFAGMTRKLPFTIVGVKNPMKVKASTREVDESKVAKAAQSCAPLKVFGAKGAVTYYKADSSRVLTSKKRRAR